MPNAVRVSLNSRATVAHGRAIAMAIAGQSYQYIAENTGLSKGEVISTCRIANVKVTDYRNGRNGMGKMVAKVMHEMQHHIMDDLRDSVAKLEHNLSERGHHLRQGTGVLRLVERADNGQIIKAA